MSEIKGDIKEDIKENLAVSNVNSYPKNIQELTDYVSRTRIIIKCRIGLPC